jgi:hypothetical protein
MFHPVMSNRGIHIHNGGIVFRPQALGGADVGLGDFKRGHASLLAKENAAPEDGV